MVFCGFICGYSTVLLENSLHKIKPTSINCIYKIMLCDTDTIWNFNHVHFYDNK